MSDLSQNRKRFLLIFLILLPLAGVVFSVLLIKQITNEKHQREAALPTYGVVPDFHLTEASAKPISLADLKGKVWVADFIYTHCAGSCPMMTSELSRLDTILRRMPEVQFVSITVDPNRDTPAELAQYAEENHLSRSRWYFLTGDYQAIRSLAKNGFHLPVADSANEEGLATHSARFALVDQNATIRGYYDGTDTSDIKRLLTDVGTVVQMENPDDNN